MSDQKRGQRRKNKKLDTTVSRVRRYWLPTIYRRSKLASITYFYDDGGGTWSGKYYITVKEFAYNSALIFFSAGSFGIGLGQLIREWY